MVLTVEPCPVPYPKRSLHEEIKEADARVSLKTYAPNNFSVSDT
jgi:hypothetical protein